MGSEFALQSPFTWWQVPARLLVAFHPVVDSGFGRWPLFAWWRALGTRVHCPSGGTNGIPGPTPVHPEAPMGFRARAPAVFRLVVDPGFAYGPSGYSGFVFGPSRYLGFAFWPSGAEKRLWMTWGRTLLSAKATGWTKSEPGIRRRPLDGRNTNPGCDGGPQTSETRTRDSAAALGRTKSEPGIRRRSPNGRNSNPELRSNLQTRLQREVRPLVARAGAL